MQIDRALMQTSLAFAAAIVLSVLAVTGAVLAFDRPRTPLPLQSVERALNDVDFHDMPQKSFFTARDGTRLSYRAYPGDPKHVVILVHGSSGTSASMHAVA